MRQIEAKMNKAMRHFLPFSSGNTTVVQNRNDMDVFLHGNHIATLCKISMDLRIFDGGGYQTVTTKSRLNALLDEFACGDRVIQKDFTWYLVSNLDNSRRVFFSGMTV